MGWYVWNSRWNSGVSSGSENIRGVVAFQFSVLFCVGDGSGTNRVSSRGPVTRMNRVFFSLATVRGVRR